MYIRMWGIIGDEMQTDNVLGLGSPCIYVYSGKKKKIEARRKGTSGEMRRSWMEIEPLSRSCVKGTIDRFSW